MKVLGGRSPYEVVYGIKPKLPAALDPSQTVENISVGEYVERLGKYFTESYADILRLQPEYAEANQEEAPGNLSAELQLGELVLVRREPTVRREGPLRFQSRVYPEVYKIKKKIARHTFVVESIVQPQLEPCFLQPLHAERLVRIDMPELELDANQCRRLEIHEPGTDT